jgi:Raf kinase inhibitor-like YbhB/YbcL family protein
MKLVSSAFDDGAAIPRRFTCDGENLSPPLQWSGAPAGTLSFVLLCDDPDAPAGTWHHWAAYDIPPAVTELAVDAAQNAKLKQAVNDFRKVGYGGPCPPHGHGPHHYHFRRAQFRLDRRPPSPSTRFSTPIAAKAGPMPTYQRFGSNNHESRKDRREPAIELNEEPAVVVRETRPALQLTPQDHQLMSERSILSLKPDFRLEW